MKNEDDLTLNDILADVNVFNVTSVGNRVTVEVIRSSFDELMFNWDDLDDWIEGIRQAAGEREDDNATRNA